MNHGGTEAQRSKSAQPDSRDSLSERVIGLAIEVHRALEPGLLESAYEAGLCCELSGCRAPIHQTSRASCGLHGGCFGLRPPQGHRRRPEFGCRAEDRRTLVAHTRSPIAHPLEAGPPQNGSVAQLSFRSSKRRNQEDDSLMAFFSAPLSLCGSIFFYQYHSARLSPANTHAQTH